MNRNRNSPISGFLQRAEAARAAKTIVDRAYGEGLRDRDPVAYQTLLNEWGARLQSVFPNAEAVMARIRDDSDSASINYAIDYLDADPRCFGSGYLKARIAHTLKRTDLNEAQKQLLRMLMLRAIDTGCGQEFRHYCRLAITLRNDAFTDEIEARLASPHTAIRYRAQQMLMRLQSGSSRAKQKA